MVVQDGIASGGGPTVASTAPPPRFVDAVPTASTLGIGSLPHRDIAAAIEFSFSAFDVLTLPSLPRRSPAEAPIAQALVGAQGVTLGQYGTVAIDVARLDPDAAVRTDLGSAGLTGFRTCLDAAVERDHVGPVKWQFVGPITVGLALQRAGAPADVAFPMAARVVRSHLQALAAAISEALSSSPQLVVIDEPFLDGLMSHDFPIAPDEAVDVLSSVMAGIEARAMVGVHACGQVDLATLMSAGPSVLSLPARPTLLPYAGYLAGFLRDGGVIVWGAVSTEGPIGGSGVRTAARLRGLWDDLTERGCDPVLLRRQSLLSPQCGLGSHSSSVAERVAQTVRAVSQVVHTG